MRSSRAIIDHSDTISHSFRAYFYLLTVVLLLSKFVPGKIHVPSCIEYNMPSYRWQPAR